MANTSENWTFTGSVAVAGQFTQFPTGFLNQTHFSNVTAIPRSYLAQDALAYYHAPLWSWRQAGDLSQLPSSAASTNLGLIAGTFGSAAPMIQTGDLKAAGATTRYARLLFPIPAEYDAAQTATVRFKAGMVTTISDTTATIDLECYIADGVGGIGSDICATAAQSINSLSAADLDFTLTSTDLANGKWLDMRVALAVDDAATGTAVIGCIYQSAIRLDIKG